MFIFVMRLFSINHLQVPRGRVVSLLFSALDLESDSLCRYDFVDVYDGHMNGQRLGRFCGTAKPGALVTNGNKMQVVMVSDANTAGSGFLAVYSAIHPNEGGTRLPISLPSKYRKWPSLLFKSSLTVLYFAHQVI